MELTSGNDYYHYTCVFQPKPVTMEMWQRSDKSTLEVDEENGFLVNGQSDI